MKKKKKENIGIIKEKNRNNKSFLTFKIEYKVYEITLK